MYEGMAAGLLVNGERANKVSLQPDNCREKRPFTQVSNLFHLTCLYKSCGPVAKPVGAEMSKTGRDVPDEVLVVGAILGDFEAFDHVASRYRAAVVRTAQSIVGREEAEDVAQEALLLAFKALPSIDDPSRFAAWLSAITRNRALRYLKREQAVDSRRVDMDELLLERISALQRPLIDTREADEAVKQGLDELPADYALVLRLRYFDEMRLKRIAAFLGVTVSTVKWRLHHGRKLLRELLESRGEKWNEIRK